MRELTLPLEQLNIKEFLSNSLNEGKQFLSVPIFFVDGDITNFDSDEIFENYEDANTEKIYKDFTEGNKYLFVTFSDCGINYPDVACIDGNEYQTIEEDEEEEYFEKGAPRDFVFTDNICLGEHSLLGYLLKNDNGNIRIKTAQFYLDATGGAGPCDARHLIAYSAIEPLDNMEVFEKPMKDYLERFINKA